MTTFKEIRGTTIEVVSTDPTNPELGQIWYNSSSGTLKGYQFANVNAWASGGNLNTGRTGLAGAGIQTAAVNVLPFKTPIVLLYQICPASGLDGSEDTDSIAVPRISLKVVISNLR